jgi:hypothetical protein
MLTNIATALKTTSDEITLSTLTGTPASTLDGTPAASLLKLTAIRSAKDLSNLASGATRLEYRLEVDPSTVTAPAMQSLLVIVDRLVRLRRKDEFDDQPFGDIPRLARLQELLAQLREQGVGVIAGKHVRRSLVRDSVEFWDESIPDTRWSIRTEFILSLHFVSAEKQEDDIPVDPGKSIDRLKAEARLKEARGDDMDDEIPF